MQGFDGAEDRVRNALASLREVLDTDDPISALANPDARSAVSQTWDALASAMAEIDGPHAGELLRTLHQLRRVDDLLLRMQGTAHADISRRLGQALACLEAAPCTVRELITLAPRLIGDLGFDRAIVSRISEGVWVSQAVFIRDDPEWAEAVNRVGQEDPQVLVPGLFETEMVRRRQPIIVHDVQRQQRVHRRIADASLSRSYVAAPILSNGRAVGLLHGDRYLQGVDTDLLDREVLRAFTEGLQLALTRAQLAEQLDKAGAALQHAATDAALAVRAVHDVDIDLSKAEGPASDGGTPLATPAPRTPAAIRERLTDRETQILELMAEGRTNSSIARALVISEGTVKQHVKHILRKLRAANRAEAVARLFER